jgi:SAM-dependent methyltransferase
VGDAQPLLYSELAEWFHLLTAPEDYEEEAAFYTKQLLEHARRPVKTVLELGSGGGNNASHMKKHFAMTLTDLSPDMLEISLEVNPELEHIQGDMRMLRLGRTFDAVFVHDAVSYITNEADLRATFETAFLHCEPGGVAFFAPDHVREHFRAGTDHGGHDGTDGRSLRYLEWVREPPAGATTIEADYAYLLSEPGKPTRVVYDHHVEGLFSKHDWLLWLREAGFKPEEVMLEHSEVPEGAVHFVALKPLD